MRTAIVLSSFVLGYALAFTAQADLVNRWSLNNTAGAAPSGSVVTDSVGGANGLVRGNGATFTGTGLTLPGTTNGNQTAAAISAYLDLPNGIISSKPNLTVEAWVTPLSQLAFQRVFDFGRASVTRGTGAAPGEIIDTTTAPGNYSALDTLSLSLCDSSTPLNWAHRLEGRLNNGVRTQISVTPATTAGTEYHYVMTVEDRAGSYGTSGCFVTWYRNGTLQRTLDLPFRLPQLSDVNNWIGRSMFGTDSCSNLTVNELRIYNHAMTAAEVTASRTAGANPVFPPPVTQPDSVTMHWGQKVRVAVLANDTGTFAGPTLAIVQQPQHGTATPDAEGRILYTHTGSAPVSDTFTYRVSGAAGLSAPTTVTVNFSNALRIANNTINVPAAPPPNTVQLTDAFPGLTFSNPLCLASPPGDTQRLFICQKAGLIRLINNVTAATPAAATFLDLPAIFTARAQGETMSTQSEQGLLGLAFHPSYATNGHFFILYSVSISGSVYNRLSRFTVVNPAAATPVVNTASERVLIQQIDEAGNHNGGDLHFGSDGYLYVTTGDEGNQNDSFNNSQTITKDFYCAVLRIDVDKKPGNLEPNAHPNLAESSPAVDAIPRDETPPGSGTFLARYSIPIDNPYVSTAQGGTWNGTYNGVAIGAPNLPYVRSEFWATGFRNPWRMAFDPPTGELWVGDVGGGAREEVNLVTRGGNYGWAFREGMTIGPKSASAPANFDTLYGTRPIYDYTRGSGALQGFSITGGRVYRGSRIPSLQGRYIFCDYVSGNIWSLERTGGAPIVQRIAGEAGIAAIGIDPSNSDLLLADYGDGRIHRLVGGTPTNSFPVTLAATNLFADLADLAPSPGLLPYDVNLPFWSDYALKRRWFFLPSPPATISWSRDGEWGFPAGMVWVKHFDLETTRGTPATKKRLETRLLVKNASGAYGVSYRWNDAGTEAVLVADEGVAFPVNVTVSGSPYVQQWQIPSRAACVACHTPQAGHALSFNTRQMNLPNPINGFAGNQISVLHAGGCFANTPESPNVLPRHLRPDETAFPREARVRSYLAVNCAYCHKAGGTAAPAAWDGRPELPLDLTGLINGVAANNGGDPKNKLIVPGDFTHTRSIVLNRMAVTNGFTRMPPLGSNELDQTNITLMTQWIDSAALIDRQTYADWRLAKFGSGTSPEGEASYDADDDGGTNRAEFLAGTAPLDGGSFLRPQVVLLGSNATVAFDVPANRSVQIETSTDLANWSLWNVPGNHGLPLLGGPLSISGPVLGPQQFFRLQLKEN